MLMKSVVRSESKEIAGHTFEEYKEMVRQFHGNEAPGILIGGFMVALAIQNMPADVLFDAIAETRSCLPDAIQLLTPCTIGNGWLKIVPFGRFALTLYDKSGKSHEGVRVFVDTEKVKKWPEIYQWFFKKKSKEKQDTRLLIDQIRQAGVRILGIEKISVDSQFAVKQHKGKIAVCPQCGEAYPEADGEICLACQGNIVYR